MNKDNLKNATIKSVKLTSTSMVITTILQIVQIIVIGRVLGPELFGLMSIVMIVIQFTQLFLNMGLSDAIIHFKDNSKKELSSLYWLNLLVGISLYLLVFLTAPLVATIYNQVVLTELIRVVGISFIITPLFIQFETLSRKKMDFRLITLVEIVSSLMSVTTVIVTAVLLDFGIWSLIWGQLINVSVKALIWLIFAFRNRGLLPDFIFSFQDMKKYLEFGLYRTGAGIANYFNSKIDQILIGYFMGPQILGLYNMAMELVMQPMSKINPILTKISLPAFSIIQDEKNKLKHAYLKMMNVLTMINAPVFIGLAAVSPIVIPILLGDGWDETIILVQILAFYVLIRGYGNASGGLIVACGKAKWSFYWNLSILFLTPPVIYFANIFGDIYFISFILVILQFVLFFANYYLRIRSLTGPSLADFFVQVKEYFILSLIMGAVVFKTYSTLQMQSSIINLIILVSIGVFIYTLSLYIFKNRMFKEVIGMVKRQS